MGGLDLRMACSPPKDMLLTALLTLSDVTKAYPGVVANDAVSFDVAAGEIHALLGENGAGKSTLVKMIYGLVRPDSGSMQLNGTAFAPDSPKAARAAGIGMVFQHFSLFEAMSVAENIALGMSNPPPQRKLIDQIREVANAYGLPLEPRRLVGDLSAGERQRVEIVRALLQSPKLLIMDEPTSVLTPQEAETLFATLRQLRSEGTSILYISHKLPEIRALCDRATVLRRGKVVGKCIPKDETPKSMAEMMVGTRLSELQKPDRAIGKVLMQVTNLNLPSVSKFGTALRDVNFNLRRGEILGIGGIAGNGQDELTDALSGERKSPRQSILLNDLPVGNIGPRRRRTQGLLVAPEERLGHAAAPDMTLAENVLLTSFQRLKLGRAGFIDRRATREFAQAVVQDFDVRTPGVENAARSLSGGNLQKYVVGREVLQKPDVLVINQPTWGVDASAAAAIRQALVKRATEGAAVLVISQDLDELMELSDHIAILSEGRLTEPRATKTVTLETLGLLMAGEAA